ncbi:contact-dependent growth inhibition system immunity protein [Candidatus Enterococcus mangumiae]|uniref:DUF4375 domain-containing protein n=1 Tax=Candidatus Enterococcus mangumiae TaxID=2230878 RepID=A0ABZ2SZY9_9ENTE|nr:contact-dependent growth inhibition system immunity protein [Enterococcus sp. DIV1094]MBO0490493.1 hypothetical protein [Enterococcus sp. DIV1094]
MAEKIKDIYHINDDFPIVSKKYDIWLNKLLNKTEDDIDENDVYTMFSQHEVEELAIKKALEFIINDPLAGELWDGQFLEQLANVSIEKLKKYTKELKELPSHIDQNIDIHLWDFAFERDEFMEKYEQLKKIISNL